jgi:hypothetical protein
MFPTHWLICFAGHRANPVDYALVETSLRPSSLSEHVVNVHQQFPHGQRRHVSDNSCTMPFWFPMAGSRRCDRPRRRGKISCRMFEVGGFLKQNHQLRRLKNLANLVLRDYLCLLALVLWQFEFTEVEAQQSKCARHFICRVSVEISAASCRDPSYCC